MPGLETVAAVLQLASEGEVIEFGGFRAVFKSPAAGGSEGWMAAEYTLPAQQVGAPLHYHRHLTESSFIIQGQLKIRVGEQEAIATPGSYAWIPPATPHAFANVSDEPVHFFAHASDGVHKEFMLRLLGMIRTATVWPPVDPRPLIQLGEAFDTYYL